MTEPGKKSRTKAVTINTLMDMKHSGEKIAMLTCYDASFAASMDQAGVDVVLVGDSLGMVVQGRKSTVAVSVEDMFYHTQCVARGVSKSYLITDLPFASYHNPETAMESAAALMAAGASMVKLEAAGPMVEVIHYLCERGIPVCAHLGLTPQRVDQFGGFLVQGRTEAAASQLQKDALAVQEAGAQMLILECIPASLTAAITQSLEIPVIGIGAGPDCDGQVLVLHDMLGMGDRRPRFVKDFLSGQESIQAAFEHYIQSVRNGSFPAEQHCYQ